MGFPIRTIADHDCKTVVEPWRFDPSEETTADRKLPMRYVSEVIHICGEVGPTAEALSGVVFLVQDQDWTREASRSNAALHTSCRTNPHSPRPGPVQRLVRCEKSKVWFTERHTILLP